MLMMKLFTLCMSFILLGTLAFAQDVDQTFQFVDEEGNVVADGATIVITELNEDGQMVVPLSVKNMSGEEAAVSMYEIIDNKPNGDWQTCAFGNCMMLSNTGYSPKSIVPTDYNQSIATEWIPEEGGYATWEAKLQIHVFNITMAGQFGQLVKQAGDEVIGYGPTVTLRFEYKNSNAQENLKMWWGYVGENDAMSGLGTQKAETYHCASFYPGNHEVAAGKTIHSVRFALLTSNVKDVKVWVAENLPASLTGTGVIEVVGVTSPKEGINEVTLTTPCNIGEKGIYVGYSFTVTKLQDSDDAYPVAVAGTDVQNSLWLKTSSMTSWDKYDSYGYGCLFMQLLLEGEFPYKDCATITSSNLGEIFAPIGGSVSYRLPLKNKGTNPLTSIDYTITADGVTGAEQHADASYPIAFGSNGVVVVTVNGDDIAGSKQKTLTITKVNGQPNEQGNTKATFTLSTLTKAVERTVVVEEYTGTGCGWCPRGWVGMEKIRNTLGDKAIGIAIHRYNSSDAMYISSYNQVSFSGAPSCRINRGEETDPYYGSGYGIIEDINNELAIPAKAAISVTGAWSADGKKVDATATIESVFPGTDCKIEYVLVADGLKGSGSGWTQSNYYYQYTEAQVPEDLSLFASGGKFGKSSVTGLTFNDVAIAVAKSTQTTAPGILAVGEPVSNSYTLSMPTKTALLDAIKTDKVSVVALLISGGKIINAARYQMPKYEEGAGIISTEADATDEEQARYSLDGRQLPTVQKGLNIVRMSDGTIKKVMVK